MERLQTTRRLLNEALPTAMVNGYADNIPLVNLPDPDDRHVVAAGIAAGASVILTWNLRHFPKKNLKKFGLLRENPDSFLSGIYDEVPDLITGSLANARRNLTRSRVSASTFVDILGSQRLVELAKRVRMRVGDL
jgi:hypothetical protein